VLAFRPTLPCRLFLRGKRFFSYQMYSNYLRFDIPDICEVTSPGGTRFSHQAIHNFGGCTISLISNRVLPSLPSFVANPIPRLRVFGGDPGHRASSRLVGLLAGGPMRNLQPMKDAHVISSTLRLSMKYKRPGLSTCRAANYFSYTQFVINLSDHLVNPNQVPNTRAACLFWSYLGSRPHSFRRLELPCALDWFGTRSNNQLAAYRHPGLPPTVGAEAAVHCYAQPQGPPTCAWKPHSVFWLRCRNQCCSECLCCASFHSSNLKTYIDAWP